MQTYSTNFQMHFSRKRNSRRNFVILDFYLILSHRIILIQFIPRLITLCIMINSVFCDELKGIFQSQYLIKFIHLIHRKFIETLILLRQIYICVHTVSILSFNLISFKSFLHLSSTIFLSHSRNCIKIEF